MARSLLVTHLGAFWSATDPTSGGPPPTTVDTTGDLDLVGIQNSEALVPESVQGFSVSTTQIDAPDYISLDVPKLAGPVTIDDSSMEFYWDMTLPVSTSNPVYDGLAEGDEGFITLVYLSVAGTITTGDSADTWPATVQSKNRKFTGNNEAAKWILNVALGSPYKDLAHV
jgi:hypothetical protein